MPSKVLKGVIWASVQRFGNLIISFVSNMVLARLLTPDDFGTVGMLMFFLALAQTFVDSGFGSALIQKKNVTIEDTSTVFYINLSLSVLLYLVLFLTAPAISRFYDIPLLSKLLRVMGVTVLIQGFSIIQSTQLVKKLDFKKLSICNILGTTVLAVSGIVSALLGCGVWSLVIRSIAGALATTILLWIFCDWRPVRIFSIKSFKELFGFGGFMLLSSTLITISNNIQSMIIGKLFAPRTLGNFTQARTIRNIASEGISSVVGQVLYPDFSNHQDNNSVIQDKLNRSVYLLSYVVVPMMFLCATIAEPLIHLVYGNQWDEAIPYFQILCIGGIPICLQDVNINVIKAKGHSKALFICNFIKIATYIAMMLLGAKLGGIFGFIWAMVIYSFVAYLAFAIIGTYYIDTNIFAQISNVFKCVALSIIPVFSIWLINNSRLNIPDVAQVLLCSLVFVSLYIILSALFNLTPFQYIISNIKQFKKSRYDKESI